MKTRIKGQYSWWIDSVLAAVISALPREARHLDSYRLRISDVNIINRRGLRLSPSERREVVNSDCGWMWLCCSPEEPAHDPERFHHVHVVPGERRVQPRPRQSAPGHEPPAGPLLHLLVTQHVPHQGPGDQRQQHRALHQVHTHTHRPTEQGFFFHMFKSKLKYVVIWNIIGYCSFYIRSLYHFYITLHYIMYIYLY